MQIHWRWILPMAGLALFASQAYSSFSVMNKNHANRYFYWGTIILDSDPLNQHSPDSTGCGNEQDCVQWDPRTMWIHMGWKIQILTLSGLPAFVAGIPIVQGLGRLGVSEVKSFMISMPILLFAWYYFIGWLIDRRRSTSKQSSIYPLPNQSTY